MKTKARSQVSLEMVDAQDAIQAPLKSGLHLQGAEEEATWGQRVEMVPGLAPAVA